MYARTAKYPPTIYKIKLAYCPTKEQNLDPFLITFTDEDFKRIHHPHDDIIVVAIKITNHYMRHMLVDNRSFTDIIFWEAVNQMGIKKRN